MSESKEQQEIDRLHEQACSEGKLFYIDPKTGYQVFTELNHIKRGHCCNSGCRHCPYREKKTHNK
ncbi:DUF5522 domain-containing protein [Bdellovibrio sp. KM01]|uniref:DUF5522 domain-containing protein n=1 Tax=Bdellovibrio sp. KM01 TaxID=2748865 RepID=UPI001C674405